MAKNRLPKRLLNQLRKARYKKLLLKSLFPKGFGKVLTNDEVRALYPPSK